MKSIRFLSFIFFLCTVLGCGSQTGITSSTDDAASGSDSIGDIVLSATSKSISAGTSINIVANVYGPNGDPLSGITVYFTLDTPSLASINASAVSSSSGRASAVLTARSSSGSVVVSAYSGDTETSEPITISILDESSTAPVAIDLEANPTSVLVEGTLTISAQVWSNTDKSTSVPDGTTVAFELANELYGSISSSSTTIDGKATATFEASSQAGVATIVATSGTASESITVQILPTSAVAISFVSAEPEIIALQGSGGTEISTIEFIVKDSNDDPVYNMNVSVELVGPNGGEYIDDSDDTPNSIEVSTGLDGLALVRLHSGSVTGPATVYATIDVSGTTMTTKSSVVSIGGGVPSAKRFSVGSELLNLPGLKELNLTTTITAYLADRYGNYNILDGTTISFICEQGLAVDTNQITADDQGSATVEVRTQGGSPENVVPVLWETSLQSYVTDNYGLSVSGHPRDGLCSILAYTKGEEHFDDINANGIYDAGDYFDASKYDTQGDPYLDYNDDEVYTGSGEEDPIEIFINSGDEDYNGVWDDDKYIFTNHKILITGYPYYIEFNKSSFVVSDGSETTIKALVCDKNLNMLSPGTTISFSIDEGKIIGNDSWELTNEMNVYYNYTSYSDYIETAAIEFSVTIADDESGDSDPAKSSILTITVEWEGNTYTKDIRGTIN